MLKIQLFRKIVFSLVLIPLVLLWGAIPSVAEDGFEESVEEEYSETDTEYLARDKWAIVELAGAATGGNSNTNSIYFGSDIYYRGEKNWINLVGSTYYTEDDEAINARVLDGRLTTGHEFNSRFYIFLLGTLKHDLLQNLDARSTLGVGGGYNLILASFEELAVELGTGMLSEDFDGSPTESYTEARIGLKYVLKLSDTARFENRTEFLPSLKDKKDYRARSEFKLFDNIYKNVGMMLKVIFDYDGFPPQSSIKKLDTRTFAGITFDFF